MLCSKCRRPAIIYQRYSGLHLCRNHFVADFQAKAKRAVRTHGWLSPGDSIAVAFSGGKDSAALLHFLHGLTCGRRDLRLYAITIDEGISGYRDPAIAAGIAQTLGVEHHIFSFREAFGTTVDEIVRLRGDSLSCSYCGVLRRRLLNTAARSLGANRLALGMNLDDEAQSVLMNTLRGDALRLTRGDTRRAGLIQRIKPFMYIPEREVALYAYLHVEGFLAGSCPYAHNALRADVRNLLNDYAWRHPSTRHSLVRLGEELSSIGTGTGSEPRFCPECGETCGETCRSCQILAEISRDDE